jgi:hypothetical protein
MSTSIWFLLHGSCHQKEHPRQELHFTPDTGSLSGLKKILLLLSESVKKSSSENKGML